jgi:hypothetical protein
MKKNINIDTSHTSSEYRHPPSKNLVSYFNKGSKKEEKKNNKSNREETGI